MDGESARPSGAAAESIFAAALAVPRGERAVYLAGACGDNQKLLQRVEALLRAHEAPVGFLPEQSGARPGGVPTLAGFVAASLTEQSGDTIGRYKLREKIGEGGCGVVYLAEQEEPVRRRVALKIIKLGMDTRQVVARFEAERQALALMDHANIAKVLDAGATEAGRPYFVMELVGGIKITDYCEQNNLDTRQRLDLFIQVCRAIQHAHQKGIIHRDIKPSNVLVPLQDGVPVPKVIDFGIAKATQGRLTDQTVFTAFEQFLGTPAYMSPEQAQLGGLDVDTRSDIYSLGVLLYELLTGRTPFDAKELLAFGLDAMRRAIQEKEPPTPSTRLKQEVAARSAGSDKSALCTPHSALDKDLDWIVMKCLEKARSRRYETANGLARDIERHLNQEPVVASPPSTVYRFRKLIHRNKTAFVAAVVVIGVLVTGVVVSTWQAIRATLAERRELAEKQMAGEEAQFLKQVLVSVSPSVASGRDTTILREILDQTSERMDNDLKNQPLVVAELKNIIGDVYTSLTEFGKAQRLHYEALATYRKLLGNNCVEVADSLRKIAFTLGDKVSETEQLEREALAINRKLFPKGQINLADNLTGLSSILEREDKLDEAERCEIEALTMRRKLGQGESAAGARSLRALGLIRLRQGKPAEGERRGAEALSLDRRVGTSVDVCWDLGVVGRALLDQGELSGAEAAISEELAIQRRIYQPTNSALIATLLALGEVLAREGKLEEARRDIQEAVTIHEGRSGNETVDPHMTFWIGASLQRVGELDQAEKCYRQAILDDLAAGTLPPVQYGVLVNSLVTSLILRNKFAEIDAAYEGWLQRYRARRPDDLELADLLARLSSIFIGREKFVEAEPLARECLAIREKKLPDDWRTFNSRSTLGGCLLGQKKYADAGPMLFSGYAGLKQREDRIPTEDKPCLREALQRLVQFYGASGQTDQATTWKQRLENFDRAGSQTNRLSGEN